MIRLVKYGLALLLLMSISVVFAAHNASQQLVELLNSFKTYQADFVQQVVTQEQGANSGQSKGVMMLSRPGKFRWQIEQPTKQLIIANGNTLWIYDEELSQVVKRDLHADAANTGQVDPATLLTGNIAQTIRQFKVSSTLESGKQLFRLDPINKDNNAFVKVVMVFQGKKLVTLVVTNAIGQTSRFDFSNIKLDPDFKASLFQFTPPPGVDVLTQ